MAVYKTGNGKTKSNNLEEEKKDGSQSGDKTAAALKIFSALGGSSGSGGESKPTTNAGAGALQGGMSGAATGASIGGGPGAIVGGGIGAVTGILQAKQAKKEALAEIQAKEIMGVAESQSKEEEQKQSIMSRLGQAIQNSLIRR